MYDNIEIKQAVKVLTHVETAPQLYRTLMSAVVASSTFTLPLALTGEGQCMNPLLWLAQNDAVKFGLVLDHVDTVRTRSGLPILQKKGFQNKTYMREFMLIGRHRRSRASSLENNERPVGDKLRGAHRLEFERAKQAIWKKQVDGHLIKARQQSLNGKISKAELTQITQRFWAGVDVALDEKEHDAQQARRLSTSESA